MFLGTPKIWWIAAGALFLGALALIGTDVGGMLGNVAGVLLLFVAMGVFGAAPMRYGRPRSVAPKQDPAPQEPAPPAAPPQPRVRPNIEAGDASEV